MREAGRPVAVYARGARPAIVSFESGAHLTVTQSMVAYCAAPIAPSSIISRMRPHCVEWRSS